MKKVEKLLIIPQDKEKKINGEKIVFSENDEFEIKVRFYLRRRLLENKKDKPITGGKIKIVTNLHLKN